MGVANLMARMTFMAGDEFAVRLSRLSAGSPEIAKKAIEKGAGIVADKIRENIMKLPEDTYRFLEDGEKFNGLPKSQKLDLLDSLGITPIKQDRDGIWNAKIGFDGYGSFSTKAYPKGLPNQLLARAAESGSPVRFKTPFVRPAVRAIKNETVIAMNEVVEDELKKIGF